MKKINSLNHKEHLNQKKVWIITLSSFLFGFVSSILSYNVSFYFQAVLKNDNVSVYYLFIDFLIFVLLFNLHKVVNKFGQSNALFVFLIVKIIFALALISLPVTLLGSVFLVLYLIVGNVARVNLDILLEIFSVDRMSGRIRGLFLTIFSLGFILGPKLAMSIKTDYGFHGVFLFILFVDLLIFAVDVIWLRGVRAYDERRLTARQIMHAFFRHKNLKRIYYIAFLIDFFYATMIVYTPIYLHQLGFSDLDLGNMFTFMLLPFLLFQYPVGRLADKYLGEKELIIFALTLTSLTVAYLYFLDSRSIYVWAGVLFMTRVGIAMLEVLRDSYFYKRIDGDDVAKIDLFRTSTAIAYIVFALISVVVLQFYPVKTVFLILFVALFTGLWPAWQLLDNKSEREIKKI